MPRATIALTDCIPLLVKVITVSTIIRAPLINDLQILLGLFVIRHACFHRFSQYIAQDTTRLFGPIVCLKNGNKEERKEGEYHYKADISCIHHGAYQLYPFT